MKSFLNPLTPALQAFHGMRSPALELLSRGAVLRTTLKAHLRLRLEQRRAELARFAAAVSLWDPVLSSPVPCSAELPPLAVGRVSPGAEVPRPIQVWELWHWEFCSVNLTANSPFVSQPLQKSRI